MHGPLSIADADGSNQQVLSEDVIITDSFAPKWMGNKLLYTDTDNDADVEKDSDCPTSLYSTDPDNGNTQERIFAGNTRDSQSPRTRV